MKGMATLYVRNVPEGVYARLRERARRNGRSVNAEALEVLAEAADQESDTPITDRIERLARQIKLGPGDPMPEDLIREVRDSG
jgi:plasmid stability protein